jgi:hypothetical protein
MTATLRNFWAASVTNGAQTFEVGNLNAPLEEVTIPGTYPRPKIIPFTCPISTKMTLWAYASGVDPDFSCAVLVTSNGCIDVETKCDAPTSASNKDPLGTYINYNSAHVEPDVPWTSKQEVRVSLSATAKSASSIGSAQAGFVYQINVQNNNDANTGAAISGTLYLFN